MHINLNEINLKHILARIQMFSSVFVCVVGPERREILYKFERTREQ